MLPRFATRTHHATGMKPGMVCLSVTCPTFLHLYHDPFPSNSHNHLLCRSLESRSACMHSSYTSGLAIHENWAPRFSVTQWFPIVMLITKAKRVHVKRITRERNNAIEFGLNLGSLSLSLSLLTTMESLQEVLIITALKLTLLQSCSLRSYNSSA